MINIDIEKCIGCSACINICPKQAIILEKNVAVINQHKCNQCGQCVTVCPVKAIYAETSERTKVNASVNSNIAQGGIGRGYRGRGKGHHRNLFSLHPRRSGRKW